MNHKKKSKKISKILSIIVLTFVITLPLAACFPDKSNAVKYQITEEGVNYSMSNQPTSSFWFPKDLLTWDKSKDKDAKYNISTIPLAKRVDKSKLTPINKTQNKDINIAALSIMNKSTSGTPSQGSNKFDCNTFSYWQYIDKLVYWGGSSAEGIIVPPSADVTDSAHKNGVPVLGTIFFPPTYYGGKIEWVNEFLQKDNNGNFPMVDKLIEVCNTYNFDGWFINQETGILSNGTNDPNLTEEDALLMQEFIKQFKLKGRDKLEIMWYDAMTEEGKVDWQNAFNDKNDFFLIDKDKKQVSDSMFINFNWYKDELLKNSNKKAEKLGINPYDLYAGIDIQANGIYTKVNYDKLEKENGKPYTSIGLYCPSWTFFSSENIDEFQDKENELWVNEYGNPALSTKFEGKTWKGISTYAVEKSSVTSLPFRTNFSIGNGYNFFINGEKVSCLDWNNRSFADVMPTYRWIIDNEGNNKLKAYLDYSNAFYGGNSLKFIGNLEANKKSTIKLFNTDLKFEKDLKFTTTAKSNSETDLDLILEFYDGSTQTIKADKKIGDAWTTVEFDISKFSDRRIKTISYSISSNADKNCYIFNFGNITIEKTKPFKKVDVTNLKIDEAKFEEEDTLAGIRLSWEVSNKDNVNHYEIYRINEDDSKSFLGACNNNVFFVNSLQRNQKTNKTQFEVVALNKNFIRGNTSTAEIEWPANDIPKARFEVSKTLVVPGETITFKDLSVGMIETVEWSFPGAKIEKSTEANPSISYAKEGVYSVTLKSMNKKGEDVKTVKNLIVVTDKARNLKNLALNKSVTASSYTNDREKPIFAVDGDTKTKWCAVGPAPHDMTIDLGNVMTISEFSLANAEAGGESDAMNTKDFSIQISTDGDEFTNLVSVKKNTLANVKVTFAPTEARYVKLVVEKPTQTADSAARIYEVEVGGIESSIQ